MCEAITAEVGTRVIFTWWWNRWPGPGIAQQTCTRVTGSARKNRGDSETIACHVFCMTLYFLHEARSAAITLQAGGGLFTLFHRTFSVFCPDRWGFLVIYNEHVPFSEVFKFQVFLLYYLSHGQFTVYVLVIVSACDFGTYVITSASLVQYYSAVAFCCACASSKEKSINRRLAAHWQQAACFPFCHKELFSLFCTILLSDFTDASQSQAQYLFTENTPWKALLIDLFLCHVLVVNLVVVTHSIQNRNLSLISMLLMAIWCRVQSILEAQISRHVSMVNGSTHRTPVTEVAMTGHCERTGPATGMHQQWHSKLLWQRHTVCSACAWAMDYWVRGHIALKRGIPNDE